MANSSHDIISATELARNVAQSIDRVRLSGRSLYISKGNQTVAELCPPPKSGFTVANLRELLASLPKLKSDAEVMSDDLRRVRGQASLPENPWD